MPKKSTLRSKSTAALARSLGFSQAETEIIVMKGTVIAHLDRERTRRGFNNTQFADFLEIPKSRWSSLLSSPEKATLDYLLLLAAKCGTLFRLTKIAA